MWHGHLYDQTKYVNLIAYSPNADALLDSRVGIHRIENAGNLDQLGICLPKALLGATLDPLPSVTVKQGQPAIIASHAIPSRISMDVGHYMGAVEEFTVTCESDGENLYLWTVFTTGQSEDGSILLPVVQPVGTHPRGYWPYSNIAASMVGSVDVNNAPFEWSIGRSGGRDSLMFVRRADDPYGFPASGNKGLYGVIGAYSFQLANAHDVPLTQLVTFGGGGKFFGAMSGTPIGLPPVWQMNDEDAPYCILSTFSVNEPVGVVTQCAVGGAAATPGILNIRNVPTE